MRFFLFIFLLLLGYTSFAQNNSLLWQISGKGLKKPSYLFGTIHIICPSDYLWTPTMKASLEKSDKLCLEIDMSDPAALMQGMTGMIDMSSDLSKYFTPEQYSKLKKFAKDSLELEEEMLQHMKPSIVLMMFSTTEATTMCDKPISYEEKIMAEMEKKHKKVMGLETVTEQLDALNSMPVDTVTKYIVEWIDGNGRNDGIDEYRKLVNAYKQQNINTLQSLLQDSEGLGGSIDALVDNRNKKWIVRMAPMMSESSVFFAVGAGHLAGTNGVISLLQKEGYIVTPLK